MFWDTRAWSAFAATTIVFLGILSAFFILKMQSQLNVSVDHYVSSSTEDFVWRTQQLRFDLSRLEKELSAYGNAYIPYDATKTKVAADILYSRFQTIDYTVNTTDEHLTKTLLESQTFISLHKARQTLESKVTSFISNPSSEGYVGLLRTLETTRTLATVFSTEALQYNQYHAHQIRNDMLARTNEYQTSLIMMMVGLILFIALIWFVNWKVTMSNTHLEHAITQTKDAARAKALFLSSMSHEFRTPLNAISGYMHLILMSLNSKQRENITAYENAIDQSIDNMVELVDQVLALDKLVHKDENVIIDTVDMRQMMQNAIKLSERQAITKNVSIHENLIDCECLLETDSGMFTQILTNLISNAVKFNHDDGDVWITCEHDNEQDSVSVVIEDNGIGIPKGKELFLFHPFERLGRESGAVSGAGTGLSICKGLCTRLGVDMGYRRGASGGCMFWLSVPTKFSPHTLSAPATLNVLETLSGPEMPSAPPTEPEVSPVLLPSDMKPLKEPIQAI